MFDSYCLLVRPFFNVHRWLLINIPAVACTGANVHVPPDTAADNSNRQLELQERAGPPRVQAPDSDEVQPTRDLLRTGMCFYCSQNEKTVKFAVLGSDTQKCIV
jgi:hypothetical protein